MIMMRSIAEMMRDTGDYQFDIYRIMREHVGSDWEKFNPFTNVMVLSNLRHRPSRSHIIAFQWLHYMVLKLLQSKDLKPPSSRVVQATAERECYNSLMEVEKLLAKCVCEVPVRKKGKGKGRGKTQVPTSVGFSCAGAVVQYGVSKGWIVPTA